MENLNSIFKDLKKVRGYEVTIFIEENNYNLLKAEANKKHLTIDEIIENLIKSNVEKWKNKN